jgi:hypothetical protein
MKLFRILSVGIFLGAGLLTAKADFSLNTEYAALFKSDGTTEIGAGWIGIIVADEGTAAGIIDPYNTVLSVGNYLGGSSDDRIIGLTTSVSNVAGTGFSGFQQNYTGLTYSGNFDAGDNLYLLWFPTISTAGSTVGAGVSYGVYRSSTANTASGADIGFVAPSDGFAYNMSAYLNSIAGGGGVTAADFTASQITAVPEPSLYGLLGVGAIGLVLFRARNRRRG